MRVRPILRTSTWLSLALAALIFMAPAFAFAQSPKIAFVDLQRALNEVKEGQAAKKKLKRDFDKKQKSLNEKQEKLLELKQELETGGLMLSEEVKRSKAQEFQSGMMELQQTYMAMQGELAQAEAKATKKIFDKMGKIIEGIAKERSYDLVLERSESAILFGNPSMDLTDELIKRFNALK
ncbi:MAG: OmpH family outer membrane protein [Myxococcota bacterium]